MGWQQMVPVVAAVLFLGFLVLRLWPGGVRRGALGVDVRAARERAHAAATPRARAEALVEAGQLCVRDGSRWTAAAGFFLRALNADPTWPPAVAALVQTFQRRRPRMLEKMLWRRLGMLPWDDAHQGSLREITAGLAAVYEGALRDKSKAEVMRRLAKTFAVG
jgi:hypothetical protein